MFRIIIYTEKSFRKNSKLFIPVQQDEINMTEIDSITITLESCYPDSFQSHG